VDQFHKLCIGATLQHGFQFVRRVTAEQQGHEKLKVGVGDFGQMRERSSVSIYSSTRLFETRGYRFHHVGSSAIYRERIIARPDCDAGC
jgi:hypothetical protein